MNINEFLPVLFERAGQAGFDAFEVQYTTGESFELSVYGGEILGYSVAGSMRVLFRALLGGKMGLSSTQVLDEDAIDLLISGAKTNAELIESEDEQFIFEGSPSYPEISVYSEKLERFGAAEKIELALALERAATSIDERISQVDMCGLSSESVTRRIVNSNGLDISFDDNLIVLYVSVTAREGEKSADGFEFFVTRDQDKIDVEAIAKKAVGEAVDGLRGQQVDSGKYRVAFTGRTMASLMAAFTDVFSADMAQKGLSLLKDKEGAQIAAGCVTIVDDPHLADAYATSPFDGEGVATARREIVKSGVLTTLMHNLKTAKKQGVATTGHAARGGSGISPSNFYIEPGAESAEELYKLIGDGILIDDLAGLHSGTNSVSGDFSLGAKGTRIVGGALGERVNQITIAGNFFELLMSIRAVGSDLEYGTPSGAYIGSPTVYAGDMSVAGK